MEKFQPTQYCPRGHNKDEVGRRNGACKICDFNTRKAYANTPIRIKERKEYSWKRYGMCNADGSAFDCLAYDRLYQIQQGRCKICGIHQVNSIRGLHVDHSHKTGIVRGLLCPPCNTKVGVFEHELAVKIKQYLGEKPNE